MECKQNAAGEDTVLEECIAYFKARPVYQKVFTRLWDKYISLGHFGGTVQLAGLKEEERQQLGGFLQRDCGGRKTITVSATALEKALSKSRFSGLKWEVILQEYFRQELVGKKEKLRKETEKREQFFAKLLEMEPDNPGSVWLKETLQRQTEGCPFLMKQYRQQPEQLSQVLTFFLRAVPRLPFLAGQAGTAEKELLAVFAANTTGDPHFFDVGMPGEQLLTLFLKSRFPQAEASSAASAEKRAELYYRAGLLKDDLSNHTLAYGIRAWKRDGSCHNGIEGFFVQKEPVLLTLMTLGGLKTVRAGQGKRVYIVENPAVFSKLIRAWPGRAVLCGNGQLRLATLALLDLFEKDTEFYYAGDFDPEGLLIAQRLKERYPGRLHFWNYNVSCYEAYLSPVEVREQSLKKLDRVYMEELLGLKNALQKQRRAAYQEAMMEEYLEEGTVLQSAGEAKETGKMI